MLKNKVSIQKTTVSIQVRRTVSTNQIKSIILLQNTRSIQEMESKTCFMFFLNLQINVFNIYSLISTDPIL